MYYRDGAGLFGENLIRLPDGRVVTQQEAAAMGIVPPAHAAPAGVGVGPSFSPNQFTERKLDEWTQDIPKVAPTTGPNVQPPMAPPAAARTAPAPTANAPVYPPNPALMAAEKRAAQAQSDTPMDLLGLLAGQQQKPKMNQADVLMAIGSGMLGLSGDPNLQKMGMAGFGQVAARRDERKVTAKTNATVDALVAAGVVPANQADALRNNPDLIGEVYKSALKGNVPLSKMGKLAADLKAGRITQAVYDAEVAAIGSPLVSMGNTDVDELRKKLSGAEGDIWAGYLKAGGAAVPLMADIAALRELSTIAPSGPLQGRLAERFRGFNTAADAFMSIINRVAPSLRVEGSGSTSDIEVEMMKQSLGSLVNNPMANALIYQAFDQKLKLNIEQASIIRSYQNNDYTEREARQKLTELEQRSIMSPELRDMINGIKPQETAQDIPEGVPAGFRPIWHLLTDEEKQRALGQ